MNAPEHTCSFEIRVLGARDARWSAWFAGQDASGRFRVTQIAVQQAGGWKCATLQFSGPIPDMLLRNRLPSAS